MGRWTREEIEQAFENYQRTALGAPSMPSAGSALRATEALPQEFPRRARR